MAENYVEIKIKASDTAKPDLTDLKVKLDELGSKVETARVDVNDEDGKAKLLAMNAKLAALNQRVANPRIKVAGAARAEADIAAVEASLKHLGDETAKLDQKAQQNSGKGGLLGKLLSGGGGMPSLPGSIPGIGGMSPVALTAIAAAAQAALVEVTGLASGFAAAGAGAGAFGVLAMPAFKGVSGALTQINADQKTYDRALTATAKNTALKHLKQDYANLDPAQRGAVKGIQGLQDSYHKMAKAFEPTAFKIFNDGLKIANSLLPIITPFANDFAKALDGLLKHVDKFTQSKGFKDWLKQFEKLSGPSVTAIGNGIGKVAVAIGKLLTIMSKKDVVNAINIAFSVLAGTISAIGFAVKLIMKQWDLLTTAFDGGRKAAKAAGHDIASAFDTVRHAVAEVAHDIASKFDGARHAVAGIGHSIASAFDKVRATIHHWIDDAINFVKSKWKLLAAIILGPFGLIQDAISTHFKAIEGIFTGAWNFCAGVVRKALSVIMGILKPFGSWLGSLFKGAWNAVVGVFKWAWDSLHSKTTGGVNVIKGVLNWFSGLAGMFRRWWSAAASAVAGEIGRLIGFVRTIPGRVNSALSGLPGMMFRAGVHAIASLISGIASGIGQLGSLMGSIASKAAGFFGLSPAKEGPLSGGGAPQVRGRHFAADCAAGLMAGQASSAGGGGRRAGTAGIGPAGRAGGGRAGAAGAGGTLKVQLEFVGGDDMLLRGLRNAIRVRGGNVQQVLGH